MKKFRLYRSIAFILSPWTSSQALVMRPVSPSSLVISTSFIPNQHDRVLRTSSISTIPFRSLRPLVHHRDVTTTTTSSTSLHSAMSSALFLSKQTADIFLRRVRHLKFPNILVLLLLTFATSILALASKNKIKINQTSLLWPGTQTDPNSWAPLPPGSFGCPFFGIDFYSGTKDYGPFAALGKLAKKNNADVWKTYSFGLPLVSVSGVDNIKSLLKHEFLPEDDRGIGTFLIGAKNFGDLFGQEGILYEPNAEKHALLRKLVGAAMTPAAVAEAVPSIQDAANVQIERMLNDDGEVIEMEKVFSDFTLDVAWKQVLGLDLEESEIPRFRRAVQAWTSGVINPIFFLPFRIPGLMTITKTGRARQYLVSKVEAKLAHLDDHGPDSSTLSKLYFARDDDDGKTKLTRTQVIHNALILIFAGTETSASTLTCASLLLALHPEVFRKIRDEQKDIIARYGSDLSAESLENCVYLDSVIKETLRIKPLECGELRRVNGSVEVDGKQIPKGWFTLFNIKQTHVNDPTTYREDGSHMDIRKGFRPERWLDETTKPQAWMPFGAGRRRCIGEKLGMTEMKVFLSMLARKVDYDLVNEVGPDDTFLWKTKSVLARPLDGVKVRARPL
ncbi:hypothetical protein ACHAXS_011183 [Conticribra weissflogii]